MNNSTISGFSISIQAQEHIKGCIPKLREMGVETAEMRLPGDENMMGGHHVPEGQMYADIDLSNNEITFINAERDERTDTYSLEIVN